MEDNSLTILDTKMPDSGKYTCKAATDLDENQETASLIVQNVPDAPQLLWINCDGNSADVVWDPPRFDNWAPILDYRIECCTTFPFDNCSWEVKAGKYFKLKINKLFKEKLVLKASLTSYLSKSILL